jgi:lysine-N-methylase
MNQIKMRPIRIPAYLKQFKCIGPACEDNCCIGWDVEFDRSSYKKYSKVQDAELSSLMDKCVYVNKHSFSSDVDHAKVRLEKDKRCPFLNEKNLCRIQAKLGEKYLSNVCATYPRYTNVINQMLEQSANVSCPEAARMILLNPAGIEFLEVEEPADTRHIIVMTVDTKEPGQPYLIRYLVEIRGFSIELLQNRDYALWERLLLLGYFYKELQHLADGKRTDKIPRCIEDFARRVKAGAFTEALSGLPADPAFQIGLLRELVDKLNVFTEVDSKRYVALVEEALKGFQYNGKAAPVENAKRYTLASRQYYEPFLKVHGYILENYLVNFVFSNLFPALDERKPFDSFIMLTLLYSLINYHLTGIAAGRRGLKVNQAAEFIQVFSKTVEHHKTYLDTITDHIRKKKFNTMEYMAMLVKSGAYK